MVNRDISKGMFVQVVGLESDVKEQNNASSQGDGIKEGALPGN